MVPDLRRNYRFSPWGISYLGNFDFVVEVFVLSKHHSFTCLEDGILCKYCPFCVLKMVVFIFKFAKNLEVANIAKDVQINGEIKFKELRVIDSDGSQLGIMQTKEALKIAEDRELDLVIISPTANPPVSRIMDYGKHIYELSKKQKEAKKNQKVINVKEIRVSPSIETHDINIKANSAKKFLKCGDKVKITVRFRGREADYSYIGEKILDNFVEILQDYGAPEKKAKLEGRNMSLIMSPKK